MPPGTSTIPAPSPELFQRAKTKPLLLGLAVIALLGIIGFVDWLITSAFSVSLLYVIPVGVAAWLFGRPAGILMSVLAAVVWYLAEVSGRAAFQSAQETFWQGMSRFGFYVLTAYLVGRLRQLTLHLESLVKTRTDALEAEVIRRKQLEREATEITEREQERIAHELHDELAAYMAGIAFRAKTIAESLGERAAPEAADADNLVKLINCASQQVRSFSRLLAPLESSHTDLAIALSHLGNEVETVFRITCAVEVKANLPSLTQDQCGQLYRIAREAVRNAVQHAHAELVQIKVDLQPESLTLNIQSDGTHWQATDQRSTGIGLRIMHHRAERLGGKLSIKPGEEGGAIVTCQIPLNGMARISALPKPEVATALT